MQIDFEFGLSQLSGNEALLIKLLGKIRTEYSDCQTRLTNMFANHQWEDAKVLVHTLKGVSGNLGCTALHKATEVVDEELKFSSQEPASISRLYTALDATLETIAQVESTGSIKTVSSEEKNPCSVNTARQDLLSLLSDNAFIPPDVLSSALQSLDMTEDEKSLLEQHINTLDYNKAMELLKT